MNQTTVESYLKELLDNMGSYEFSSDEQKQCDRNCADFIVRKLDRKKFRRKLTDTSKEAIREKILQQIKKEEPIHFVIPFGGYKHYWNPSHPEPDWAEVFHFVWLLEYIAPILSAYKPGVIIEYVSEEMILNRMNNYPEEVLNIYTQKFQQLIDWVQKDSPKNLQWRFFRVRDRVDAEKLVQTVENLLPERRLAFEKLSQEEKDRELHRSIRSVFWKGTKDLSNLSEEEKRQHTIDSRLIELAYYDTEADSEFLGKYFWEDNHICLCFSFGLSHDNAFEDLTISSAHGSIVDFWIGRGVLVNQNGKLSPRVVSKLQYGILLPKVQEFKVNVDVPALNNLQTVEIVEEGS